MRKKKTGKEVVKSDILFLTFFLHTISDKLACVTYLLPKKITHHLKRKSLFLFQGVGTSFYLQCAKDVEGQHH
jgi:hypothetical protein